MKSITPEDWLKTNCKLEDWDRLEENLVDFMSTNNIIIYMKDFNRQETINTLNVANEEIEEASKKYKSAFNKEFQQYVGEDFIAGVNWLKEKLKTKVS